MMGTAAPDCAALHPGYRPRIDDATEGGWRPRNGRAQTRRPAATSAGNDARGTRLTPQGRLSLRESIVSLLIAFVACIFVGQAVSVTIGLVVERFTTSHTSLLVF